MNALKNISKRICAAVLAILIVFTVTVAAYPKERVYAVDPVTLTIEEVLAWLLMSVGIYDNSSNDISSSPLYQRDNLVYQVQNSVYGQQSDYVQSGVFASALDDMIDSAVNGVSGAIRINEFLWNTVKEWSDSFFHNFLLSDDYLFIHGYKFVFDDSSQFLSDYFSSGTNNLLIGYVNGNYVLGDPRYTYRIENGTMKCSSGSSWLSGAVALYLFDIDDEYCTISISRKYNTYSNSTLKKYQDVSLWDSLWIGSSSDVYYDSSDFVLKCVSIPWITGNVLLKDGYDLVTKGRTKADNGSLVGNVAITIPATKSISNIIEGLRAKEAADEDTYIPWVDAVTSVGAYPVSIADDIVITGTKTDEDEKEVPVVTPIGEWLEVLEKAEVEEPTTEEENTEDLNEIPLDNITVPYVPAETGTYIENLKKKFPFCIPFDLVTCIQNFRNYSQADEAPVFTFTLPMPFIDYTWTFTVDMNDYLTYVKIFRFGFLILFLIGLMFSTSKLIGWQLID